MAVFPRRLKSRIILAVACILLVTGATSGWISARHQADRLLATMHQTSSVIVKNLAESCTRFMLVEDYAGLEAFLLASAELPDLRRLRVAEPDGKLLWDVDRTGDALPRAKTGIARIAVPATATPSLAIQDDALVVWQPIVAGKTLGWLKAEYGLEGIRQAQASTWRNTLLMTAVWVAFSALLIILVLRPTIRSISRLTEFSKRLEEHVGEQTPIDGQALEIAELATSLNETSAKLLDWKAALVAQRESLRRTNRKLRAISTCNQTLIRAVDEPRLLDDICRIVCEEAGYRMAWVGYAEHDEAKSVRPVAWAGANDGYLETADVTWADDARGQGPTGTAIRTGNAVTITDYATDPRVSPWRDEAMRRGYGASIALPLKDEGGKARGALTIYSPETGAFTPDEVALLEELAGDLAFGIVALRTRAERERAEEDVRKLNIDLERRVAERTA